MNVALSTRVPKPIFGLSSIFVAGGGGGGGGGGVGTNTVWFAHTSLVKYGKQCLIVYDPGGTCVAFVRYVNAEAMPVGVIGAVVPSGLVKTHVPAGSTAVPCSAVVTVDASVLAVNVKAGSGAGVGGGGGGV